MTEFLWFLFPFLLYAQVLAWSLTGTWLVVKGVLGRDFMKAFVGVACWLFSLAIPGYFA